ncbi:NAD(P)H-dependent oxidoreductase [Planotetraspora phitsanulokensis]|uniref:FMN reductase n=1 Tax=Planotetraspora phitsanulokensis TaxID=575192 RepID=A0A8J3UDP2_9ACTN|nr:NAD(P)H-dependent oxidoreductase [Planotetraspora phitsanulokensis]GII43328.1 FMN reductase [Planotetraspora phitsanulokensis]
MSIVTLVGNPREGSRTLAIAVRAAEAVAGRLRPPSGHPDAGGPSAGSRPGSGGFEAYGGAADVVDLAALAPHLLAREPGPGVESALKLVLDAEILVVASPTYKGTYTGLLKVFLDRLPHQALAGKAALPLLVMGDPKHSLAVEVHLRPLLVELGASVPTPGLVVLDSVVPRDFGPDSGATAVPELDELLDRWAGQVVPGLPSRQEVPA